MFELTVVKAEDSNFINRIKDKFFPDVLVNNLTNSNILIISSKRVKFANDNIFYEDSEYWIIVLGIMLNRKQLLNYYASTSFPDLIIKLFKKDKKHFIEQLRGDFVIVVYEKNSDALYIYNDHKSSIPLFYYTSNVCLISTSMHRIVQIIKIIDRKISLDHLGAYFMLTYGYMLDDYTLINEVKKLKPGTGIQIIKTEFKVEPYYLFSNTPFHTDDANNLSDELYQRFLAAIKNEYEKDVEYGYEHIATLSGGLDSRLCVMTANFLGYRTTNVTISQTNYLDEKIAKRISSDLKDDFIYFSIDNARHLLDIEENVKNNDGLILYSGSAHMCHYLKKIDYGNYGVLHTGMIGDGIAGSFNKKPYHIKPKLSAGTYSTKLLSRIETEVTDIQKSYANNEMFLLYNRLFNGAFNGLFILRDTVMATSPFLNIDVLEFALKVPPSLKYNQKLYRKTIKDHQPKAFKYIWETTSLNPKYPPRIKYITKGIIYSISRIMGKADLYVSMNPFNYWYKTNEGLRKFIEEQFKNNLYLLDGYQDLKKDCRYLYEQGTVLEKTQVNTLLEAVKFHFINS